MSSPKQTRSENFIGFLEEGIMFSKEDTIKDKNHPKTPENNILTEVVHVPKKSPQLKRKMTQRLKSKSESEPEKKINNKPTRRSWMPNREPDTKQRRRIFTFLQKTRNLTLLEKVLIPIVILFCIAGVAQLIYFTLFNTEKVHGTVVFEEDVSALDLNDPDSEDYKQIQEKYQKALAVSLGSQMAGYRQVNIKGIRPGSLVVDFDVDVDRTKNPEVCNNVGKVMSDMRKDGLKVDGKQVKSIGTYTGEEGNQTMTEDCTNLLPGIEGLQFGYDLKFLDIDDLSEARRKPIIQFECFHGKNKIYRKETFQVPSAILSHISDPHGSLSAESILIRDSSDLQKSYGWSVGVKAKYKFVTASASVSYSSMKRNVETNEWKFLRSEIKEFRAIAQLQPPHELNLHENFATDIRKLPQFYNNATKSQYEDFLNKYGTHYFIEAKLGGKLTLNMSVAYNYESTTNKETWEQTASLMLESGSNYVGLDQSYNRETIDFHEKLKQRHTANIKYHGGSKDLGEENKVVNWQPTVAFEPVFVHVDTLEISELVKNKEKKSQLEKAIDDHLKVKDGYGTDGFLDTGYGQPCRHLGDCNIDLFHGLTCKDDIWKCASLIGARWASDIIRTSLERPYSEEGYYLTGQCKQKVCVCHPDLPGVWSISQKTCLPKCDNYHESKFVHYPGQGFYQPNEGVDTYLNGEGVTPAICAAECTRKWPEICMAFVFFTNGKICQFFTFSDPNWQYVGLFDESVKKMHNHESKSVTAVYGAYDGPERVYIHIYLNLRTSSRKFVLDRNVIYGDALDLYKRACY